MRDKVVHHEMETLREREQLCVLSPVALEIHLRSVERSARSQWPAFVPDSTLDALAPGHLTTMAALELSLAGLWHRAKDGYVVSDLVLVEQLAASPLRRAAHRWATRCASMLVRAWRAVNRDNFVPL
ncbi:MAG: hypothetical protein HYZ38_10410 [Mycobacterium sp.]|nr:hypothetical protein [Mycobacterium sp.]